MPSTTLSILYSPFPDVETARAAATALLTERLAACCNLLPASDALYWWEGAIAHATETVLLAKTTHAQAEAAIARLTALHPYECPAILRFSADATPAFARWVEAETTNPIKS